MEAGGLIGAISVSECAGGSGSAESDDSTHHPVAAVPHDRDPRPSHHRHGFTAHTPGRTEPAGNPVVAAELGRDSVDCALLCPSLHLPAETAAAAGGRDDVTSMGVAAQVGRMREIFDRPSHVMVPTGLAWLNLAEPLARSGAEVPRPVWRIVLAVQADGWALCNAVMWTTTPGWPSTPSGCSVGGSATAPAGPASRADSETYQTLYLLTAQRRYYFARPDRPAPTPRHLRTDPRSVPSRCAAARRSGASTVARHPTAKLERVPGRWPA
jgi:hypothetical protein